MDATLVTKILAKIGYVLLNVQSTERVIKRVMKIAMPHESDYLVALSERLASKDMDRPLGAFLTELRKRAELNSQVDVLFKRFLLRRNVFIHDISKPKGWTLKTKEGLLVINSQLEELLADSTAVRTHFLALLYSWKVQGEMEPTKEEDEAFRAITAKYEGGVLSRKWGE
ncbi:hypothetical protein [Limnobacter profundi]|uniref:Apea-like HEPN domain-containing protein n=1 Tax=Limnobacter profundi TaxID=2732163 RepID=A0ABX6N7M9_9BURK|nr:hypothetical protein [Limnobacter sp. SAORIC-580]QJR30036.1 hypothetical protein HKT17_10115 [Limnobacter sp. SAORIC-580]